MVEIDKNRIIELCDQIKAKLKEEGKSRYIVRVPDIPEDDENYFSDVDQDIREQLDEFCSGWGCIEETRLVSYDCGNYSRTLQLDGVALENDTLYFYLTEMEVGEYNNDIYTLKVDLDGFLDDRAWWMSGGTPEVEFRPDEVLEYYISSFDEEYCKFLD